MNNNNRTLRNKRTLTIIVLALFIGIPVLLFLQRKITEQPSSTVLITNLASCVQDINPAVEREISSATYTLVKSANDYNKKASLPKYTATIRKGSCTQESQNTTTGYDGNEQTVRTTSIVLDIPDAKQSWKISFDWVADKKVNTDLGTIMPDCLPAESLPYGDFNCYKIMSLKKYGTENYDAILQYMPYTGSGFDLSYDPDTKVVTATIYIPTDQKDNQELIENDKAIVPYWFEHRGLDINQYTVEYRVVYE